MPEQRRKWNGCRRCENSGRNEQGISGKKESYKQSRFHENNGTNKERTAGADEFF
jgi:hypothetical protein